MWHELTRSSLAAASERAKAKRCRVRMLAWRQYEVEGSAGHVYVVRFRVERGVKLGSCTCASRVICRHVASAAALHVYIAKQRAGRGLRLVEPARSSQAAALINDSMRSAMSA